MLSRALARLLQAPIRTPTRLPPSSWRIVSTIWTRSMAHHNKPPNAGQNKPLASKSGPQQNQSGSALPKKGGQDFSKNQDEFSTPASPSRNTAPQSNSKSSQIANREAPEYSTKQDEFDTSALASENTAPQFSSPSAINPAEAQARYKPLPDLTQGIPSTLDYELSGAGKQGLNLTEAEKEGQSASSGGRGRGELPASAYVSSSEKKRAMLANYMYAMFAGLSVAGTIYLGRNWETEDEESRHPDAPSGWGFALMWNRVKARMADQLNYYNEPAFRKLLPDPDPMFERPYTLVLSMEDLLIHSEWTREHGWRMAKRPGMDYFLRYMSQYYELVLFTTQPFSFAEPVVRKLDPFRIVTWPLFREATLYENGGYIKDLSYLNRDLSKVIMIDTKASHASHQPENAIILPPWEGDPKDTTLVGLIPFLEYIPTMSYSDVRKTLASFAGHDIPNEFARREAIARAKFQEQLEEERKKKPRHSGVGSVGSMLGIKPNAMMVMSDPSEQTPAEAFAQGKMLQDQARERGQKNYELLEKEIRENGEKWLKEEAAQEEKAKQEVVNGVKSGFTGWIPGIGKGEKK